LPKSEEPTWRPKLQAADAHLAYAERLTAALAAVSDLRVDNRSAARSLEERVEETLTHHR
jgi:putative transposase